jgi:hypothetical protein
MYDEIENNPQFALSSDVQLLHATAFNKFLLLHCYSSCTGNSTRYTLSCYVLTTAVVP